MQYKIDINKFSQAIGLDLAYFFKSGLFVFLRFIFVSLCSLLLSVGFARLGNKELFGQYQTILAFLGLVTVFSLPGLNMSAYKAIIHGDDNALSKAVKYSFFSSFLALPVILGYAIYLGSNPGNTLVSLALLLSALLFPFFAAPNTWSVFYEAHSNFYSVSWRIMLQSLVSTLLILATLFLKGNLIVLLMIYIATSALFNWFYFVEIYKGLENNKKGDDTLDFKYGFFVTIQKFVVSSAENLPILVVSFLFGFELLAIFQLAYFFINAIVGFFSGLSATYMPILFKSKFLNFYRIVFQNLFLGTLLFVAFKLFLELFFLLLYGDVYRESLYIARNLSYIIILMPLKIFLLNYFTVLKKNYFIIKIYLLGNFLSLGIIYFVKDFSFLASVSLYMYSLNFLLIVPLLIFYLSNASKKTSSI